MAELSELKADRRLVDMLTASKALDSAGREAALDMLYPADKWGHWISRLLLIFGVILILSGIIYFFAFNWAKMSTFYKFALIEGALIVSIAGAYILTLERLSGKLFLLGAAVLVGVFMAVFGQIYQTGANAFELFRNWSLMILIWAVLAKFIGLWSVWWLVSNLALALWWMQSGSPGDEYQIFNYTILAIFNGACLIAVYHFAIKGHDYLYIKWSKMILNGAILLALNIAALNFILGYRVEGADIIAGLLALVGHVTIFVIYRFIKPDIGMLALLAISTLVIVEAIMGRVLFDWIGDSSATLNILLMGIFTIAIFALAGNYLRRLAKRLNGAGEVE